MLPHGEVMVVVGHSYGGVIASLLASGRYGVQPASVVAAGVKVTWSDEELAGFEALATQTGALVRHAGGGRGPVPQGIGAHRRCHR